MIRSTILRTALPTVKAFSSRFAPRLAGVRMASTTLAPTNVSEPPPSSLQQKFAPGEEIDPQLNGYPQLPPVHFGQKPALGWTDMQSRSNFGETLHEEDDVLGMWGPDYQSTSGLSALGQLTIAFTLMGVTFFAIRAMAPELPAVRREFPFNGLDKETGGQPGPALEYEDEE